MEKKQEVSLIKMFTSTFTLSMFTFGGGFVIVPLMKKKFVDELHWVEEKEMMDLVAIAQSSPGAIAVNGSIIIGYRLKGIVGALVNILATVLPPLIILTIISYCYDAFRRNAGGGCRGHCRCRLQYDQGTDRGKKSSRHRRHDPGADCQYRL